MEELEIVAVPDRIGSEVQRSPSREVPVRCPGLGKERQNRPLENQLTFIMTDPIRDYVGRIDVM